MTKKELKSTCEFKLRQITNQAELIKEISSKMTSDEQLESLKEVQLQLMEILSNRNPVGEVF